MASSDRGRIAAALLLILLGAAFLAVQLTPAWAEFFFNKNSWPLAVVGVGAVFGVIALVTWTPGLWAPACIISGVGGILWYQNYTGDWETWAYAWTLIPGFVGVGIFLEGLFGGHWRRAFFAGGWMVLISLIMFLGFSAFMGGPNWLGPYWPVLIILLGVLSLGRALFGPRRRVTVVTPVTPVTPQPPARPGCPSRLR